MNAVSLATGDGANDIAMLRRGDLRRRLPRQAEGARRARTAGSTAAT